MVIDNLRLHLRRIVGAECTGVYHRRAGQPVERRTNEQDRGAITLSRFRKTVVGVRHALGLLRFLAVFNYLVRQSSRRDRLLPAANTWCMGRRYHHRGDIALFCAVSLFVITQPEAQSTPARTR